MKENFDIIIIGGSFAGLSFAIEAAKKDLKILVVEKRSYKTDKHPTTGMFYDLWLQQVDLPIRFLTPGINNFQFNFPNNITININKNKNRFFFIKTEKYLQYLTSKAEDKGVKTLTNHTFTKIINKEPLNLEIEVKDHKDNRKILTSKYLIGADGAKSCVANELDLDSNYRFLTGIEYVYDYNNLGKETILTLFDYNIAPGYFSWLGTKEENMLLGLAAYSKTKNLKNRLDKAKHFFEKKTAKKFEDAKILKGAPIPINGPLENRVNEFGMLLGDAAGFCGSFGADGIFSAIKSGQIGAKLVTDYLQKGTSLENFKPPLNMLVSHRSEMIFRKLFDRVNDNKELEHFGQFFNTTPGKKLLTTLLVGDSFSESTTELKNTLKSTEIYDELLKIGIDLLD